MKINEQILTEEIRQELIPLLEESIYHYSNGLRNTIHSGFCGYFQYTHDISIYFGLIGSRKAEFLRSLLIECRRELFPDSRSDAEGFWFFPGDTKPRLKILKLALNKLEEND